MNLFARNIKLAVKTHKRMELDLSFGEVFYCSDILERAGIDLSHVLSVIIVDHKLSDRVIFPINESNKQVVYSTNVSVIIAIVLRS